MVYSQPNQTVPARIVESYGSAVAVTPADNAAIGPFAAVYVGGAGNIALVPRNSPTPVTFYAVPAGAVLRVACQGVNATGTTATNLVGLG